MMKKKVLAVVMAAVMTLGMSITGCGSTNQAEGTQIVGSESDPEGAGKSEEQIVLKYTGWGSPTEKKTTQNVIKNFEKEHPNVKVEYMNIPFADYNTKLTTMIAAGKGPDLALLNGDTALYWATQGKLKNILEFAKDDTEFDINNILPQTIYWWDKDKACGVNGALEVFGLMYNKDAIAAAGIEVPTKEEDAWSWDEFVETAQKLTIDNNGKNALDPEFDSQNIKQFGLYIPDRGNMVSYAMAYSDQDFLNEDGTKVNLMDTKGMESIQKFADLINKYHVAPNPAQSKNLPGGATALSAKKVAMIWDGQWSLQELSMNKVNFGVGIAPKMYEQTKTISMGEPIVVFETTKHPKEAWELQKAFMNPENTMELIESGLWMPVQKEWYENQDLINQWAVNNPAHPEGYIDAILNNGFTNCVPALTYSIQNFPKIMDIMTPALDKVWLGESSAAEAIGPVIDKMNAEVKGKYERP